MARYPLHSHGTGTVPHAFPSFGCWPPELVPVELSCFSLSGYRRGGCVALATGSAMGLWEVKNCTSFRARYICRQSLGTPVTPELPGPDPTPSLTGSCPQGWASDPKLRHCYKVGYSSWRGGGRGGGRDKNTKAAQPGGPGDGLW